MFDRMPMAAGLRARTVIARAVGALALAALAVIHVVDLPGTLGPTPLVGVGYLGIIAAAIVIGGVMITRPHWLAWAAAGAVAVSAMGGYVLTRALPGGFLGDHGDVGNWRCPLGIAALSVEALIILLVVLAAAGPAGARPRRAPGGPAPALRAARSRVQPARLTCPGRADRPARRPPPGVPPGHRRSTSMRMSQPGPRGQANAAPWRRWLLPAAVTAIFVTLLALPRGASPGMTLSYTRSWPTSAPGWSAR